MKVLAFDPGGTTGWAVFVDGYLNYGTVVKMVDIKKLIVDTRPDYIAIETFKLFPWAAKSLSWSTLDTVKVIGVMEYIAAEMGIPTVLQSPADAKAIKIKRLNASRHAVDAVCHGLLFLRRQGKKFLEPYREYLK